MSALVTQTLDFEGAQIYCEARGSRSVLLLIPGGNGEAAVYRALAESLSDRFTVVSYDRRGFARSKLASPPDDLRRLDADCRDARFLIDRFGSGPAYVFGSSSGAIVALELLTRFPNRIRRLVAHEPPLATLVPDAPQQLAILDGVYATYRASGAEDAMRKFAAAQGIESGPTLPSGANLDPRVAQMMEMMRHDIEFWLEHELRQYPRVTLDLPQLRTVADRLVLAGGRESRSYFPYRPNTVLAELLHLRVVDFPGGHVGYATHPAAFASQLAEVLLGPSERYGVRAATDGP